MAFDDLVVVVPKQYGALAVTGNLAAPYVNRCLDIIDGVRQIVCSIIRDVASSPSISAPFVGRSISSGCVVVAVVTVRINTCLSIV